MITSRQGINKRRAELLLLSAMDDSSDDELTELLAAYWHLEIWVASGLSQAKFLVPPPIRTELTLFVRCRNGKSAGSWPSCWTE
jgi:hypothetical protein